MDDRNVFAPPVDEGQVQSTKLKLTRAELVVMWLDGAAGSIGTLYGVVCLVYGLVHKPPLGELNYGTLIGSTAIVLSVVGFVLPAWALRCGWAGKWLLQLIPAVLAFLFFARVLAMAA